MKAQTLEILWHGKEPVLSVDQYGDRLATGGADSDVKIWRIQSSGTEGSTAGLQVTFLSNLSRHTKSVNAVRFSPTGEYLASAGDDGAVVIWKMDDRPVDTDKPKGNLEADVDVGEETWKVVHLLRAHVEDVYDIAWSPDSCHLASASIDNTVHVWDVHAGKSVQHLKDHKHYVQGVTWSPDGQFLATQSSDRTCRVYSKRFKKNGTTWEFKNHAIISHQPLCNPNRTKDEISLLETRTTSKSTTEALQTSTVTKDETANKPTIGTQSPVGIDTEARSAATTGPTVSTTSAAHPQNMAMDNGTAAQSETATTTSTSGDVGPNKLDIQASTQTQTCKCTGECACTLAHTTPQNPTNSNTTKSEEPALPPTRLVRLFQDENGGQSYFRRLNFSPDGSILGAPCGVDHTATATAPGASSTNNNTSYFFAAKRGYTSPIFNTPCMDSPSNEIKFCPVAFERRRRNKSAGAADALIDLPYRLVFAVMTVNSVIFYDTQQLTPFAMISDLHYAPLTDLSWSTDGNTVVISSQDGYCSILSFTDGELGNVVTLKSAVKPATADIGEVKTLPSDSSTTTSAQQDCTTQVSTQASTKGPTTVTADTLPITDAKTDVRKTIVDNKAIDSTNNQIIATTPTTKPTPTPTITPAPTPRRIQPTAVNTSASTTAPKRITPKLVPSPAISQLPSNPSLPNTSVATPQQRVIDSQAPKPSEASVDDPTRTPQLTPAHPPTQVQPRVHTAVDCKRVGSTTPKRIAPTLITPVHLGSAGTGIEPDNAIPQQSLDSSEGGDGKRRADHVENEGSVNKKRSRIAPTLLTTGTSPAQPPASESG